MNKFAGVESKVGSLDAGDASWFSKHQRKYSEPNSYRNQY